MDDLRKLADLIRQRNDLEVEITRIIQRPAQVGHIGEFIAAKVFGIALAFSASEKGSDGRFEEGPFKGADSQRQVVREARGCSRHRAEVRA